MIQFLHYHYSLIPLLLLLPPPSFLYTGADRKLYVADLAIRTEARRFGIATQLLLAIELYAYQNHYQEIYLHVEVDNVVARNMYFKNGYVEVPRCEWASIFTQSRLHKSVDSYVFLW